MVDRQLRSGDVALAPQGGDHFGRQEVRVDDHIPRFRAKKLQKPAKIQLLDQQPQAVALVLCRGNAIEQVVEIAQRMGHSIHQVEIRPAIELAEGGVGEVQHVEILHDGRRIEPPQGQLDGLGGAQMAGAHGCR